MDIASNASYTEPQVAVTRKEPAWTIWSAAIVWPLIVALTGGYLIHELNVQTNGTKYVDIVQGVHDMENFFLYVGNLALFITDIVLLKRRGFTIKWHAWLLAILGPFPYMLGRAWIVRKFPWYLVVWLAFYVIMFAIAYTMQPAFQNGFMKGYNGH